MQIGADSRTLTLTLILLDLLNPKSVGCDRVSRTTTVLSFKSLLSGYTPTHPDTHPHTLNI